MFLIAITLAAGWPSRPARGAAVITSKPVYGDWTDSATWVGGGVPSNDTMNHAARVVPGAVVLLSVSGRSIAGVSLGSGAGTATLDLSQDLTVGPPGGAGAHDFGNGSSFYVGYGGTSGVVNQMAGIVTLNAASATTPNAKLVLGADSSSTGAWNISAGTLTASSGIWLGNNGAGTGGGSGTLTISNAVVNSGYATASTVNDWLTMGYPGSTQVNTININASGYLKPTGFKFHGSAANNVIKFNGGAIIADPALTGSGGLTLPGGATIKVADGGATFFADSSASVIQKVSILSPITPDTESIGGLTKGGGGYLYLGANNTYAGPTVISSGTLMLSPALTSLPDITTKAFPGGIALQRWFDATDPYNNGSPPDDGTALTTWNDKSGLARNATAGNAPLYKTNRINGKAAVDFSGSKSLVLANTGLPTGTNAGALFAAGKPAAAPAGNAAMVAYGTAGDGGARWLGTSGASPVPKAGSYGARDTDMARALDTSNLQPLVISGVWNNAGGAGGQKLVDNVTSLGFARGAVLQGGRNNGAFSTVNSAQYLGLQVNGADYWNGDIGEVLMYSGTLTEGLRHAIDNYLNHKWLGIGVTGDILPSTTQVQIADSATLSLAGATQRIGSLVSTGTTTAAVTLDTGTLYTGGDNANTAFNGVISGPGNLIKEGAGNFTLGNVNTFCGTVRVDGGSIVMTAGGGNLLQAILDTGGAGSYDTSAVTGGSTVTIGGLKGSADFSTANGSALILSNDYAGIAGGSYDGGTAPTFSGALSNIASLQKGGSGRQVLTGASTFTGPVTIGGTGSNNGTLAVTWLANGGEASPLGAGASAITLKNAVFQYTGTTTTSTDRGVTLTGAGTIDVLNASGNMTIGPLTAGGNTFTKIGLGTLTLGGAANSSSNTFLVQQGNLVIPNGSTMSVSTQLTYIGQENGPAYTMGNSAAMIVEGGGAFTTSNQLYVGRNGATGTVIQKPGSSVSVTADFYLGYGGGDATHWSQGKYYMLGGTTSLGYASIAKWSSNSTAAVSTFHQTGGTVNTNLLVVGEQDGTGSSGVYAISGGTLNVNNNNDLLLAGNAGSRGTLNISGSGAVNITSPAFCLTMGGGGANATATVNQTGGSYTAQPASTFGVWMARTGGGVATYNLAGGTLTAPKMVNGAGTAALNFNGGTLKANNSSADFLVDTGAAFTVPVYSGGAIIDTDGNNITINRVLSAPANSGVLTIPVSDGGSGYSAPPLVTISGGVLGSGTAATAVANISGGVVTSISIANPGMYTDTTGISVALSEGIAQGAPGTPAMLGTPTFGVNVSGGLTKNGGGTLTLSQANTYTGDTLVNAGTLSISNAYLADTAAVKLTTGAVINLNFAAADTVGALWLNGVSQGPGAYDATTHPTWISGAGSLLVLPPSYGKFWAPAPGGGGSGAWASGSNVWSTTAGTQGALAQSTTETLVFEGAAGTVTVNGTASVTQGAQFNTDGYSLVAGATSPKVSLDGAAAAGNTIEVTTGTTTISAEVAGGGAIGLVKAGNGKLVLAAAANTYAGGTTVNAGTLQADTANALPAGSNLTLAGAAVTALGGSTTVNLGSAVKLADLSLNGHATSGLTATLNLNKSKLIVDKTQVSVATIRAQIKSAYAAARWTGAGITSAAAAADYVANAGGAKTGVGYLDNALAPAQGGGKTTWQGRSVDSNSVLVRFTYYGDCNLDGQVNLADFGIFKLNFGTGTQWYQGDFDYSGSVNLADFGKLKQAFGSPAIAAEAAVPEPAAWLLLASGGVLGAAALRRRRRRSAVVCP